MALSFRKERIYSKSRKSPGHAYIDPNARGTGYIILYAYGIYTAVRHKIPLPGSRVLGLGSRVSMVSGLRPWSLVTWSPWLLDHWVYRVIGLGSLHGYGLYWVMGSGLSMAMVSIGSWARVKPLTQGRAQGQITSPWSEPSQQPRVKPTDQGLGSSPGSSPQTRAKPNYPGYGSGSWVKPLTHGLSPGSNH